MPCGYCGWLRVSCPDPWSHSLTLWDGAQGMPWTPHGKFPCLPSPQSPTQISQDFLVSLSPSCCQPSVKTLPSTLALIISDKPLSKSHANGFIVKNQAEISGSNLDKWTDVAKEVSQASPCPPAHWLPVPCHLGDTSTGKTSKSDASLMCTEQSQKDTVFSTLQAEHPTEPPREAGGRVDVGST